MCVKFNNAKQNGGVKCSPVAADDHPQTTVIHLSAAAFAHAGEAIAAEEADEKRETADEAAAEDDKQPDPPEEPDAAVLVLGTEHHASHGEEARNE